jgi:hypothetical protein
MPEPTAGTLTMPGRGRAPGLTASRIALGGDAVLDCACPELQLARSREPRRSRNPRNRGTVREEGECFEMRASREGTGGREVWKGHVMKLSSCLLVFPFEPRLFHREPSWVRCGPESRFFRSMFLRYCVPPNAAGSQRAPSTRAPSNRTTPTAWRGRASRAAIAACADAIGRRETGASAWVRSRPESAGRRPRGTR